MNNTFSQQSEHYAAYRPVYPAALFSFIESLVYGKNNAWDCGTGNGQVAWQLKDFINNVYATDISSEQLRNAALDDRITYSNQPAEKTNFSDQFFDLITVAQAIHWFDFEKFYSEARRTLKPGGIIAVFGYSLHKISPEIDQVIDHFYKLTGPYWDPQRKYLDEHYRTIPFPFDEIEVPEFTFTVNWSLEHLIGYLNTWSAVKHFIKAECYNPVNEIYPMLKDSWGDVELRTVNFPLFVRVGAIGT